MQNFWPSSGFDQLQRNARGWLEPTDDYLRLFLQRPELALLPESCPNEIKLHTALLAEPARTVGLVELAAIKDADARESYSLFVNFRNELLAAGTLEACYLGLFRRGVMGVPPLFLDLLAQAIVRNVLDDSTDAYEVRAGEMLFRQQRLTIEQGQILAGDLSVLDMLKDTGGLGDIGRLLAEAKAPLREVRMEVLSDANAANYWRAGERYNFLLDLTHEVNNDLSHGLVLTMTRARSGLTALARVLEKWVQHLLGVAVRIKPLQKIDDAAWRWHVGLDVNATALLNDLYEDRPVEAERMQRLLSLFRLEFANPQEMRADVAGKPVYLGLMMNEARELRLKPQNLLLNLPLPALA
ncbi:MAG: hypothetical protein RL075_2329 [Pseudomonadota bacterium]